MSADAATAYAAGHLTPDELSVVGAHIDGCVSCRKLLSHAAELLTPVPSSSRTDNREPFRLGDRLAPGDVVGRYVVDAQIGAGGMGLVYAVRDPELGRRVAIKVLRVGLVAGDRMADLLRREAMAMARIAHPNVVGVHDLFVADGTMFVAMEFIEGTTLRAWLRSARRSWREVLGVLALAGRGLAAAHAEGVVHRDFKPENILLGHSGRVCVSDFGLSRFAGPRDAEEGDPGATPIRPLPAATTVPGGTPRYMAPEQRTVATGTVATAQSDQYSFCVVLYEALYGEHPFGAELPATRQTRELPPPPPGSSVPGWMHRCLVRGLSEDPAERYPRMQDLLAELGRDPAVKRRRIGAALAAMAVAAIAIGGWARSRSLRAEACAHPDAQLVGIWDDARRATGAQHFGAIGTPFAKDEWGFVERALDRYTRGWAAARKRTCEEVVARGEPADVEGDPRIQCLEDRLEEARAVVDGVVAAAGDEQVGRAVTAAESLQTIESCARAPGQGLPRSPVPRDKLGRARRARADLARAAALSYFGRYDDAAALAEGAAALAERDGNDLLLGQALRRAAHARENTHKANLAEVEAQYYRAIEVADAVGDDATRASAWFGLLFVVGVDQGRLTPAQAERFFDQGLAAVRRLGGDDALEGLLRNAYASVLSGLGEHEPARAQFELALEASTRAGYMLLVGEILDNAGQADVLRGDLPAAREHFARAALTLRSLVGDAHWFVLSVRSDQAELSLQSGEFSQARDGAEAVVVAFAGGPHADGAEVTTALQTQAEALLGLELYDAARSTAARSLALRERRESGEASMIAPRSLLGRAYLGLHQPAAAIELLEPAAASRAGEPVDRADARFALARALTDLRRDSARALSLATEARDLLDHLPRPTPLQASKAELVRGWITCASSASGTPAECPPPPARAALTER